MGKTDVINIGVASHITAASRGTPRYNESWRKESAAFYRYWCVHR